MKYFINLFTAEHADGTQRYLSLIQFGGRAETKAFESKANFEQALNGIFPAPAVKELIRDLESGHNVQRQSKELTDEQAECFGWRLI